MGTLVPHLFVHEYVDDGVDDGAALGQEWRDHAGHRTDDVGRAKRRHHGHHAVRHPAQQVAGRRGQNHEEYVVLSPSGCGLSDFSHLQDDVMEDKSSPLDSLFFCFFILFLSTEMIFGHECFDTIECFVDRL